MRWARTVRICKWDVRVNSLWLWWYCILMVFTHGYLVYRAVLKCKRYNEYMWDTTDKPVSELYIYITLIVLSIMCIPFFVISALFKIGNYPNDGVRLGRDNIHKKDLLLQCDANGIGDNNANEAREAGTTPGASPSGGGRLRTWWRHTGPMSHGVHVVAAFLIMLPMVLIEAQEVRFGFLNPDTIWSSELDVLFGKNILPPEATEIDSNTTETMASIPIEHVWDFSATSPEYVNYVMALVIFSLRYGAVFWYTSMGFSVLLSGMLLIAVLQYMFQYCGMAVLYKFIVNHHAVPDLKLALSRDSLIVLYLLANTFTLLSFISMFNYGFYHYMQSYHRYLKKYYPAVARKVTKLPVGCQGYLPHIMATVSLVVIIGCRATIVYDYVVVYRHTDFSVLLGCIVLDAGYIVTWIALWFGLTVKQNWAFRIGFRLDTRPRPQVIPYNVEQDIAQRVINGLPTRTSVADSSSPPSSGPPSYTTENNKPANGHANGIINDVIEEERSPSPESPPQSPISALRKGGERRNNPMQRVKFDENVKDDPNSSFTREQNQTSSDNRKRHKRKDQNVTTDDIELGIMGPTSRIGVVRNEPSPERTLDSASGYTSSGSTPENTLTRTYRHSLRDKCGEYYTVQDAQSPPAAQSSPVMKMKNRPFSDHISDRQLNEYLELKPWELYSEHLHTDKKPPLPGGRGFLQLGGGSDRHLSRPRMGPVRTNSDYEPMRWSGRKVNENRHSFPPPKPETPKLQRYSKNTDDQIKQQHDIAAELDVKFSYNPPQNKPEYSTNRALRHTQSHDPDTNQYATSRQPQYEVTSIPIYASPKPRVETDPRGPAISHAKRNINRELKFVSKPDLNRRDSALPSSNDTSSNDSEENMLCSQV